MVRSHLRQDSTEAHGKGLGSEGPRLTVGVEKEVERYRLWLMMSRVGSMVQWWNVVGSEVEVNENAGSQKRSSVSQLVSRSKRRALLRLLAGSGSAISGAQCWDRERFLEDLLLLTGRGTSHRREGGVMLPVMEHGRSCSTAQSVVVVPLET